MNDLRSIRVIHNPHSGKRATNILVRDVARRLIALGHDVDIEYTLRPGHATELAGRAARQGVDVVLAAGGDGTAREVAQGLAGSTTALGVIPIGTVNVWASEMQVTRNVPSLVAMARTGVARRADLGMVGGQSFMLMASLGFDAAAVQAVRHAAKRALGRHAYVASAARLLPGYRGVRTRITMDGETLHVMALIIVIGNTRRYGGRSSFTPEALVDDGVLDVVVVAGTHAWRGLPLAGSLLLGANPIHANIIRRRAKEIVVESESPLPVQIDGDFAGLSPAKITVRHGALGVLHGGSRAPVLFSHVPPMREVDMATRQIARHSFEQLPSMEKSGSHA